MLKIIIRNLRAESKISEKILQPSEQILRGYPVWPIRSALLMFVIK